MFWHKRKEQGIEERRIFTGDVRFVENKKLYEGRIFGRPFRGNSGYLLVGPLNYYVEVGDKVHIVPEYAIEEKR